jgi:hypothetical protein
VDCPHFLYQEDHRLRSSLVDGLLRADAISTNRDVNPDGARETKTYADHS